MTEVSPTFSKMMKLRKLNRAGDADEFEDEYGGAGRDEVRAPPPPRLRLLRDPPLLVAFGV